MMNRIALFLPNWIGDVVMATPAIRAVRATYPRAELVAVCKPYVADVLAGAPWFDATVFAAKRELFGVARALRAKPLDAALLFPNSIRTALIAHLAGAKRVVGYARYGRGFLLSDKLYAKTDARGAFVPSPALDDYNRLVVALGTPNPGTRMELFTTSTDEASAAATWDRFDLHRYPRVVVLNSGGAFGAAKDWGCDHFAHLARLLTTRLGCGVLVACGPNERAAARRIADESRSPHVFSLSDSPLSLGLTKAVVRRADLLVTTDSGPRHFAAAFGRPVVSLFGPTHIEWTETYYAREIRLQKKLPCGPCQQRVCPLSHHRCMRELAPADAFATVARLLRAEVPRAA
jgi:heptosyltransferase-2